MARTSNFNKTEIVSAALEIVRKQGADALTARSLSKAIGCSTSPLFTVYGSLEEIHKAVKEAAIKEFSEYVKDAMNYVPAFKEYGLRLVRFAQNEPNLFKLIFMTPGAFNEATEPHAQECIDEVRREQGLDFEQSRILLKQVWTFACGIAMLEISGAALHTEEQISEMLSRQFVSSVMFIKSGITASNITPHLRANGEKAEKVPSPGKD